MNKIYTSLILFLPLLILSPVVNAQDSYFKGTVMAEDQQPLLRAAVLIYENEELLIRTFTDEQGKFETNIRISAITGVADGLNKSQYDCFVYPNPLTKGPLKIQYQSPDNQIPQLSFFTIEGRPIQKGSLLLPGTYIYKAIFNNGKKQKIKGGLFSVLIPVNLDFKLNDQNLKSYKDNRSNANLDNKKNTTARNSSATIFAADALRVEIKKDEYITHVEEINTTNPGTADKTYSLKLAPKPVADFEILSPDGSADGNIIGFDASVSTGDAGEDLIYAWDFGDSSLGGQKQIAHIYAEEGNYTISLTVTGNYGARTTIDKDFEVTASAPASGTAAVLGSVTDSEGNPLPEVAIALVAMEGNFTTNQNGEVGINGFPTGKPQILEVSKQGYITEYYKLFIRENQKQGQFHLALIERQPAVIIEDVEFGGAAAGVGGASVTLPADGLVKADGSVATGEVEVYITPVDISDEQTIDAFPGDFSGITFDGPAPLLLSYGTADYTFMQDGEKLQLAAGKTAQIDIPIYVTEDENGNPLLEGDEYPLWAYSEQSGTWIEEGTGVVTASFDSPTGLVLRGEVSHFSWWNHDVAPEPFWVVPICKINDKDGLPTLEIPKGGACTIGGRSSGSGPQGRPRITACCIPVPLPPNTPVLLSGTGGNGLYTGTTEVNGAAGVSSQVIIPMEPVADPNQGGAIAADTSFVSGIGEEGEIDTYTFEAELGKVYFIDVSQTSGSNLEGSIELRDPDNLPLGTREFNAGQVAVFSFTPEKEGTYYVTVDGIVNEPGAYELSLTSAVVISKDSETNVQFTANFPVAKYAFEGAAGQIINVAYVSDDISGRVSLKLQAPDGSIIKEEHGQAYVESGVLKLPEAGFYKVEVRGNYANLEGDFIISFSSIEEPKEINLSTPFTTVEGEVTQYGKKKYYKFQANGGERINFGLKTSGSLAAYAGIATPDEIPFYDRHQFQDFRIATIPHGVTNPFTLAVAGEYIIGIDPNSIAGSDSKKGSYEIYLAKATPAPAELNTAIEGNFGLDLEVFKQFYQYNFTGTNGDNINIEFTWVPEVIGRRRIYISLFSPDGTQIYRELIAIDSGITNTGNIRLPADGSYILDIESVDANSLGDYSLIISK